MVYINIHFNFNLLHTNCFRLWAGLATPDKSHAEQMTGRGGGRGVSVTKLLSPFRAFFFNVCLRTSGLHTWKFTPFLTDCPCFINLRWPSSYRNTVVYFYRFSSVSDARFEHLGLINGSGTASFRQHCDQRVGQVQLKRGHSHPFCATLIHGDGIWVHTLKRTLK